MEHIGRQFAMAMAMTQNPRADFWAVRSVINGYYIGSRVDQDPVVETLLTAIIRTEDVVRAANSNDQLKQLEQRFSSWILRHQTNTITGLEQYEPDYSEGSTQAFDSFYFRHRHKRFRCLVGEYFYHPKTWISTGADWSFITDEDPLSSGDALVLSVPFCDTVGAVDNYTQLMQWCEALNIPVLLDLCYWPISHDLHVDLCYNCIDTVAFSLSKAWPVGTARIGMRYTRPGTFDGQKLHHSMGYNNNVGAMIGNILLDNFAPDWIYNTRQSKYKTVCEVFDLQPTNSVNFGIGDSSWDRYNRRELLKSYQLDFDPALFVNRICVNRVYQHWDLFRTFCRHELSIEI
jgi:hypothetical protein